MVSVAGVCSAWSQSLQSLLLWRRSESGYTTRHSVVVWYNFTFQQDGAPFCRWRQTVAFLRLPVPEFVEPENLPPNSPDLNAVYCLIWEALQQLVYRRRRIRDVEHLKEVVQTCWEKIGQDVIDRAVYSLVVATGWGHIEHRFK